MLLVRSRQDPTPASWALVGCPPATALGGPRLKGGNRYQTETADQERGGSVKTGTTSTLGATTRCSCNTKVAPASWDGQSV